MKKQNKKLNILISYGIKPKYLRQIRSLSPKLLVDWAIEQDEIIGKIHNADILYAGRFNIEIYNHADKLQWIQATSAGIERLLFPEFVKSSIPLYCARSVYDIAVAEHTLALLLGLTRQIHASIRSQIKKEWTRPPGIELHGKIMGIVGFGSIGKYLSKLVKPMGMKVIGWKRNPIKNPKLADKIWTGWKIEKLFSISDVIVVILPKTKDTNHLINRKLLSRMKSSAYIVNIGRGNAIDEKALAEILRKRKIAGAGLDVFEKEPLPKSSPLWKLDNLIITPHIGGYAPESEQRMIDLFCTNLKRYLQNKSLLHLVDKKAGY